MTHMSRSWTGRRKREIFLPGQRGKSSLIPIRESLFRMQRFDTMVMIEQTRFEDGQLKEILQSGVERGQNISTAGRKDGRRRTSRSCRNFRDAGASEYFRDGWSYDGACDAQAQSGHYSYGR